MDFLFYPFIIAYPFIREVRVVKNFGFNQIFRLRPNTSDLGRPLLKKIKDNKKVWGNYLEAQESRSIQERVGRICLRQCFPCRGIVQKLSHNCCLRILPHYSHKLQKKTGIILEFHIQSWPIIIF